MAEKGYELTSDTDTEALVHLLADAYDGDLVSTVRAVYPRLEGHFAFLALALDQPDRIVGARLAWPPLVVGVGEGEDVQRPFSSAFLEDTRLVQHVREGEIVEVTSDGALFPAGRGRRAPGARRGGGRRLDRGRREGRLRERSCSRRSTSSPPRWRAPSASACVTASCTWTASGSPTLDSMLGALRIPPQFAHGGGGGEYLCAALGVVVVLVVGSIWRRRSLSQAALNPPSATPRPRRSNLYGMIWFCLPLPAGRGLARDHSDRGSDSRRPH